MNRHRLLNILILAGLIAGVGLGFWLNWRYDELQLTGPEVAERIAWLKSAGDIILIRPLKMLIIPLIFASVIVGITSIGDPSRLGLVGGATMVYFFVTMILAGITGAVLVTTIHPGAGVDAATALAATGGAEIDIEAQVTSAPEGLGGAWLNIIRQMIPENVFAEAADGQPLPVIAFAIFLGLALGFRGERSRPVVDFINAFFEAIMVLVSWVLWLAPIGIFFLVAWTIAGLGGEAVRAVGKYMLTVFIGLAIHGAITLPLVLAIFGRTNPYRFMWRMRPALLTAFGTDSSSATLPVTIETAETAGECSKKASGFVLPLGSTINMDGTALYEAVAVVFLFQVFGVELGLEQLAIVVMTATLAAVGAAGIPSAGLVTMVLVVQAVNATLPETVERLPLSAIGILFAVDRILDMCRTTVNVWGDAVGAKMMTRLAPDTEEALAQAVA